MRMPSLQRQREQENRTPAFLCLLPSALLESTRKKVGGTIIEFI